MLLRLPPGKSSRTILVTWTAPSWEHKMIIKSETVLIASLMLIATMVILISENDKIGLPTKLSLEEWNASWGQREWELQQETIWRQTRVTLEILKWHERGARAQGVHTCPNVSGQTDCAVFCRASENFTLTKEMGRKTCMCACTKRRFNQTTFQCSKILCFHPKDFRKEV